MKFCTECGAQNEEQAKFCSVCGAALSGTPSPKTQEKKEVNIPSKVDPETADKLKKLFHISPDETVIACLGNSYLQNLLLEGSVSKTVAVVTNRRLYYQGRMWTGKKAKFSREIETGTVPLKDISYTGVKHFNPKWKLVVAGLLALPAISTFFQLIFAIVGA